MMNSVFFSNALRFIFLVLLQTLLFKQLTFSWIGLTNISVIIYPIFIFLLPHRTTPFVVIALGFLIGFAVDIFYSSPGVHASAMVLTAFLRPLILKIFEPRGGYDVKQIPSKHFVGRNTFVLYAGTLLLIHLLMYFSMLAFSFVFIGEILLRTIISFFPSLLFVVIYQYLFDPKT